MADYQVTLQVPEFVYEIAKRVADETAESVEQVLQDRLNTAFDTVATFPIDDQIELNALYQLSDDALFGMVGEQMNMPRQARMVVLGERNSLGTITPEEYDEYSALVARGNRLMLRKAWAAKVLIQRGYEVTEKDFAPYLDCPHESECAFVTGGHMLG